MPSGFRTHKELIGRDGWERAGWGHTRAHTMRVPFEVIDISVEKWAPSKLHMSRITESGRAWWSAVWSLILALTQCWAAVSSGRKQCLKTCRRSSTFSVRHDWSHFLACGGTQHTALLTKHFRDISINTATDHTHTKKKKKTGRIDTGWNYTGKVGLIRRNQSQTGAGSVLGLHFLVLRHRLIVIADVSWGFSTLRVDFFVSFYLCLAFSLTLCVCVWVRVFACVRTCL